MEPTLLPVRPGTLTNEDRNMLREVGIIVIEHENPDELRLIRPYAEIDSGKILYCAMQALMAQGQFQDSGALQREKFTKLLAGLIKAPK